MSEQKYDSKQDTLQHINRVKDLLEGVAVELVQRGHNHDASKLENPEKELFDTYTPLLKQLEYGSDEYKESLEKLKPALEHHYANNSHHPEYYENGVDDMDLFDVVEMLCDWKAATERTKNGDIYKSIEINQKRFNLSPQLTKILLNTIDKL